MAANESSDSVCTAAFDAAGPLETVLDVVASTVEYRALASARPVVGQRVLEIGPAEGHCTELLAARAVEVLAMDNSKQCVERTRHRLEAAQQRLSALFSVELFDVMAHPAGLRLLGFREPHVSVVFADIGGSRALADVLKLLSVLRAALPRVHYVALKSEALCAHLAETKQGASACWRSLEVVPATPLRIRGARDVIRAYPLRHTATAQEICKLANFWRCLRENCPKAHNHCHLCGLPGHLAPICPHICSFGARPVAFVEEVKDEERAA